MRSELRIIDASANRAREAARVMEDVARFMLDDRELSAAIKGLRHDLSSELDGLADPLMLAAWRDTPGDVGTTVSTPTEMSRRDAGEMVVAAAKRLGEALRSLEECAKIGRETRAGVAAEIEKLRYRAYELERRLTLAVGTGRAPQWALCVLITSSMCDHMSWEQVAREAIAGGADCLQLREKDLDSGALLERARRTVAIAREHAGGKVWVIVNDRPDIAMLSGADGVHVGQTDLSIRDVRQLAGGALIVGISTTNMDQARQAAREGADYCGLGPMFPTTTKHKPAIAGPAYVREYLSDSMTAGIPHLAIGGISPENVGELRAVGCRGIAVSGAVIKKQRPAVACQALRDGLAPTH